MISKSLNSLAFSLSTVAIVAGCSVEPTLRGSADGPEQVRAGPGPAATYSIEVGVLPRIGLFNANMFSRVPVVESRYGNDRLDAFSYQTSLLVADTWDKSFRSSLKSSLEAPWQNFGDTEWKNFRSGIVENKDRLLWELLTTDPLSSGYATRTVYVTIKGLPSNSNAICEFQPKKDGPVRLEKKLSPTGCTIKLSVESNLAQQVEGTLRQPGRDDKRLLVLIPEDFTIVALGDSFASGEGNPDAPATRTTRDDGEQAIWMDEQCHRSVWSGPIQAGIKMINGGALKVVRDDLPVPVLAHGAFTIASFACSGATMPRGVNGPSDGTVPLVDLKRKNARFRKASDGDDITEFLRESRKLYSQLEQLDRFIWMGQRNLSLEEKKFSLEALTLSVGGNDVYFAPMIEAFLRKSITLDDEPKIEAFMKESFDDLNKSYGEFAADLERKPFSVRQTLITEYPDPTRFADGKPCPGPKVLEFWNITETESQIASRQLLGKLNAGVQSAANDSAWLYVGGVSDGFRTHGYCSGADHTAPDPTTGERPGSWFRSIGGSLNLQADVFGAFHPTQDGHAHYAKRMFGELISSLTVKALAPDIPSRYFHINGSRVFVPPTIMFEVKRPYSPTERADKMWISTKMLPQKNSDFTECALNNNVCEFRLPESLFGTQIKLSVRVRNSMTRRVFEKKYDAAVIVDGTEPELSCKLVTPTGSLDCNKNVVLPWIVDSNFALEVGASDADSGVVSMEASFWKGKPEADVSQIKIPDAGTSGERERKVTVAGSRIADGVYGVTATATDLVGINGNLKGQPTLRIDRIRPALSAFTVYGLSVPVSGGGLIIPVSANRPTVAQVSLRDETSGVGEIIYGSGVPLRRHGKCENEVPVDIVLGRDGRSGSSGVVTLIELEVKDCAGLAEKMVIGWLPIGKSGPLRSLVQWNQTRPTEVAALTLFGRDVSSYIRVNELVAGSLTPLMAAWLNLLDGRASPEDSIAIRIDDSCSIVDGAPGNAQSTVYALLMQSDVCERTLKEGARDDFRVGLASSLMRIGLI